MNDAEFARKALAHCQAIARFSEVSGAITRTFLSEPMRGCCAYLSRWMESLGMQVTMDAAGNLRGVYEARHSGAKRVLIGSHLDTVPDAGPYDGVLGVVIAISLVELLDGERLPFAIEVIGFSEEEGMRFGVPFIGSKALIGALDEQALQLIDRSGISIRQAIRGYGLDPSELPRAELTQDAGAYLEFHIEQGPVLESIDTPLAAVHTIAGQSRAVVTFRGSANHAGTTPMRLRHDALCGAAEWVIHVENYARTVDELVATVGRIEAKPGAANVIPGETSVTLDVRHRTNSVRRTAFETLLQNGQSMARHRGLTFESCVLLDQNAVPMHCELTHLAEDAIEAAGVAPHHITSGTGHDAMILASSLPSAMIFIRSPGGISHHPDETVKEEDVRLALRAGFHLLHNLSKCPLLN